AVVAGKQAGAGRVEDLTLETPLVLPEQGAVRIQITVAAPDASGRRPFSIHSQPDSAGEAPLPWVRHARGTLSSVTETAECLRQWPPADAVAEPLTDVYPRLADAGYEYGPVFQNLRALWKRGEEIFA